MRKYRQSIIFLLICFWIFYNIERIDFGARKDLINMKYYAYILSLISSLLLISFKRFARINVYFSIGFVLVIWLIFNLYDNPYESIMRGGMYTYLAVTEMTFLSITIALARYMANLLNDVELTIENITLIGTGNRVKLFNEAKEEVDFEVYRSRRNNSELSLLLFDVNKKTSNLNLDATIKEFQTRILQHYNLVRLARMTGITTRRADIILLDLEENQIGILSPDTNRENAEALSYKVKEIAKDELNIDLNIGITTMPDDAKTFEELYSEASKSIKE